MHHQQPSNISMMPVAPGQLQAVFWHWHRETKEAPLKAVVAKLPVVALAVYSKSDEDGNVGYEIAGLVHDPETGKIVLTSGEDFGFSDFCHSENFLGFESTSVKPDWETRTADAVQELNLK
jgi:hypothetical protein